MKEIQLSQGRFCKNRGKYVALVDDEDFENLNQYRWSANKHRNAFYAVRYISVDGKEASRYMHVEIMGKKGIDHIDHNGLNNQRSNLRFCTLRQNQMNRQKQENASSIYKGVHLYKPNGKWQARIKINGKNASLGSFALETDAALAYNAKAIELFCEFACLNEIN